MIWLWKAATENTLSVLFRLYEGFPGPDFGDFEV